MKNCPPKKNTAKDRLMTVFSGTKAKMWNVPHFKFRSICETYVKHIIPFTSFRAITNLGN